MVREVVELYISLLSELVHMDFMPRVLSVICSDPTIALWEAFQLPSHQLELVLCQRSVTNYHPSLLSLVGQKQHRW
jgi:hypothetical protein